MSVSVLHLSTIVVVVYIYIEAHNCMGVWMREREIYRHIHDVVLCAAQNSDGDR